MKTKLAKLTEIVNSRFGGVLKAGQHHVESGECCGRELLSAYRRIEWTDENETRCWDIRSLNDVPVSDEVRTECLLPVLAAYDGSMDWPIDRQRSVAARLAIATVNQMISTLPNLPPEIRLSCAAATDVSAAAAAAAAAAAITDEAAQTATKSMSWRVAESATRAASLAESAARDAAWAESASWVTESAARAAAWAAESAESAAWAAESAESVWDDETKASAKARESCFRTACKVWLEAAQ